MNYRIFLALIFFSFYSFSQTEYSVTAKSGLTVRDAPGIAGRKIGKLEFDEKITLLEETDFSFSTEQIHGFWVKIQSNTIGEGYVFNGFLKLFTGNKIKYTVNNSEDLHKELIVTVNGKETVLISFGDESCFDLIEIQDYNNDGYEEVLLESNACGGNCCGNSLFTFSFNGNEFERSAYIGYYFGEMNLNYDQHTNRQFVVETNAIGAGNTTLCEDLEETYVFDHNDFKLIESKGDHKLTTLIELKSSDFLSQEAETDYLTIAYDLDGNGVMDQISGSYWERWGILNDCTIVLNNEALEIEAIGSPKRIGVLASKTNNVNDIVIECDTVLIWNGINYEKK
ncbi:SH3 domain-containing protein [Cellulophaga baltica]|uniref:SH3 domain-containing protein n=1 Tax=Cellulophaga baltica TaxID=76594 RepID=UPI0015F5D17A|nr:SH3 domain-containing protein [Cellulophaga baltica]MBA6315687.1 SH3 domain-containing protein [Cellulophaga baltica]